MNRVGVFMMGGAGAAATDSIVTNGMALSPTTTDLIFRLVISAIGGLITSIVMPWLKAKYPEIYARKKKKKVAENGEN